MSDAELRAWMKGNGVWQLDLCKMLNAKDVDSLDDFKQLSKEEVLALIDAAKKTGFMHTTKLKALHGGFPKKKKKKAKPKAASKPKEKGGEEMKRDCRPEMESWMRDNNIWQIDLFDLMSDEYQIYSPSTFDEYKEDPDWVDEFLTEAKHCGVMGPKAIQLASMCGRKKKGGGGKKKKKKAPSEKKPKQKSHEEMKMQARPVLEKYLRANDVWQIDLFDMMVDKYEIYTVQDFEEYKEDEDWIDEYLLESKQCGVMGNKAKRLEVLCGKKAKKKKKKKAAAAPKEKKEKVASPEEIRQKARKKMEPFMQEQGFWHKDLFLILLEYDVRCPGDMGSLSKADRNQIVKDAKQKGLIGGKVKKFKAHFQ